MVWSRIVHVCRAGILVIPALLIACGALAQSWPTKPVRFVVPAQLGTSPDIFGRLLGDKLAAIWGQQVLIENRGGGGGAPAMVAVVRAAPDGATFAMISTTAIAITPYLLKEQPFNPESDLVPVATIGGGPMLLAVNPSVPAHTLPELVKLAKAQPGKLNLSVSNLHNIPHLSAEMLSGVAGIQLYPVAYNGSNVSLTAAISGEAHVIVDGAAVIAPHVKSGRLRAIALTSLERMKGFETVPTVAETYPKFQAEGWFALLAPAKTPQAIVERVNRDINTVMQMPDVVARFEQLGNYPITGDPKFATDFIRAEQAKWSKVIRDIGVKPQ